LVFPGTQEPAHRRAAASVTLGFDFSIEQRRVTTAFLKSLLQVLSIRLCRLTARRIGHSLGERFRADELPHCLSAHAGSARNLVVGQPKPLESPAFFIPGHTFSPVLITSLRWCGRSLRHSLRQRFQQTFRQQHHLSHKSPRTTNYMTGRATPSHLMRLGAPC
jgi:hypothetical protein